MCSIFFNRIILNLKFIILGKILLDLQPYLFFSHNVGNLLYKPYNAVKDKYFSFVMSFVIFLFSGKIA
jgi:hypothetical protein